MTQKNKKPQTNPDRSAEAKSDAAWADYNTVAKVVGMEGADALMIAERRTYDAVKPKVDTANLDSQPELFIPELAEKAVGRVATGNVITIDVSSVDSEYAIPVTVEQSDVA